MKAVVLPRFWFACVAVTARGDYDCFRFPGAFMRPRAIPGSTAALLALPLLSLHAQQTRVDWNTVLLVSRSTPTLQVVVNPMLYRGAPIHDASFAAVKALGADFVRYVPWLPYPKAAVAELEPPSADKTSWDFISIDPVTQDFFAATKGHSTVINFSTIPAWMFKTAKPVAYPDDPGQVIGITRRGRSCAIPRARSSATIMRAW